MFLSAVVHKSETQFIVLCHYFISNFAQDLFQDITILKSVLFNI